MNSSPTGSSLTGSLKWQKNRRNPERSYGILASFLYIFSVTNEDVADNTSSPAFQLPNKKFFTLEEACALKGLNLKTAYNKRTLQPNRGTPDGKLGGRKVWGYPTIAVWITQLDDELLSVDDNGSISTRMAGFVPAGVQKKRRAS